MSSSDQLIVIKGQAVREFDVYEEHDILFAGFSFANVEISQMILQLDTPLSSLQEDGWGAYVEIDGEGAYNLRKIAYDGDTAVLCINLGSRISDMYQDFSIELPAATDTRQRELLVRMAAVALRSASRD